MKTPISGDENTDWLENLLKEESAYIDDSGFTANVIAQLPSSQGLIWKRRFILGLAILGAVIAGYFSLPSNIQMWWHQWRGLTVSLNETLLLEIVGGIAVVFFSSCLLVLNREK